MTTMEMDMGESTHPSWLKAVTTARENLEHAVRDALAEGAVSDTVATRAGMSVDTLGEWLAGNEP